MKLALVLIASLSACAGPQDAPPSPYGRTFVSRLVVDPAFSQQERLEIMLAAHYWYNATAGRVDLTLADWGPGLRVRRYYPEDAATLRRDAQLPPGPAGQRCTVLGWYDENNGELAFVPDRLFQGAHFHRLVMHEIGHALHLRWTDGDVHNPDPESLMSSIYADRDFTPGDLNMCRARGFCR